MIEMVKEISRSFEFQDLRKPTRLLDIKINRNHIKNTIHISQPLFINVIAKHFDIQLR